MRYALKLVVPPAVEPLTLGQAKDHCRINPDVTEEDDLITAMIVAARILAETQLHRQLITQTWLVAFDSFPIATSSFLPGLDIPLSPVQSVSLQYYDADGVLTTLGSTAYELDAFGVRSRLRPIFGSTWPVLATQLGAVRLSVVAGFGDTASDVPASIVLWLKCAVAAMYENRTLSRDINELRTGGLMNSFLEGLLDPYRIIEI